MGETIDPQGLDNRTKYYSKKTLRSQKPRQMKRLICGVLGESCPYMKRKEGQSFRNYAELKYTLHSVQWSSWLLRHLLSSICLLGKMLFAICVHYNAFVVKAHLEIITL